LAETAPTPSIKIGIDTGGTFTDIVVWKDGRTFNRKVPSTPANPSLAVIEGLSELLTASARPFIVHGTTVAANALLERKGGRIALLTTAGFEDVLSIGRQIRKKLYSLQPEEKFLLLPANLIFGVKERTLADGTIEKRVKKADLRRLAEKIRKAGVEAVALCFLHSYANPTNEEDMASELEKSGLRFSISSRLLPEHREFERTTATAVNAYLMPVMDRYLTDLSDRMASIELRIMQSNEGYILPERARLEPIRTALSGPAGGVVGARRIASAAGFDDIISFDMGGTSTDVSLIDGSIRRTNEGKVGDFTVRLPMIDINTVGAGGGSIAYLDSGGSLRVGPISAGADPGPACYGKGGLPTVTDADLLLGRLFPEYFLGGKMKIKPDRSLKVIERLARKTGKTAQETAMGIVSIANANMEKAIRVISVERGFDPRDFALFSFGGAGGMHAVEIASDLGIKTVIVPRNAGVLSAFGLLMADSIKDSVKSLLKTYSETDRLRLEKLFGEMEAACRRDMEADGFSGRQIIIERSLDCRYLGQSYEISVPYPGKRGDFVRTFHRLHEKTYSYQHPGRPIEIVNLRVKARGLSAKIKLKPEKEQKHIPAEAGLGWQFIWTYSGRVKALIYDRERLMPGNVIRGAALLVDAESTAYLPDDYSARVDCFRNLIIKRRGPR